MTQCWGCIRLAEPFGLVEPLASSESYRTIFVVSFFHQASAWLRAAPNSYGPEAAIGPASPYGRAGARTSFRFVLRSHSNYLFREAEGHISIRRLGNTFFHSSLNR